MGLNQVGVNNPRYKHGGYIDHKTEYSVWKSMNTRCNNPKSDGYRKYGARGIKICTRWLGDAGFANFLLDMGKRPSLKYSIDRIDGTLGYSPENCRWATIHEQNINTTRTRYIEIDGLVAPHSIQCKRYGIDPRLAATREKVYGWSVYDSITKHVIKRKPRKAPA